MAPRFRSRSLAGCLAAAVSLAASACMPGALPPEEPPKPVPTPINEDIQSDSTAEGTSPEDADAFVAEVQTDLKKLWVHLERTAWVKSTFITHDTELLEAAAQEQVMEYLGRRIKEARRFEGLELKPETARALHLLKLAAGLPAPDDAAKRSELASISSKMSSAYAKGKHCSPKLVGHGLPESKLPLWKRPKDGPKDEGCRNLGQLSKILAETRDEEVLREAWVGWHDTAKPLRPMYERFVELGNAGAKEIGFSDMGAIWKGRYDLPPADFQKEMGRLWGEVQPLYEKLHCYVRSGLQKKYGEKHVKSTGPLPAHLLGNMWAQQWDNVYPLVEPYPKQAQPDLTEQLKKQDYDAKKMVRLAEKFFVSLGMDPLPSTFWERSLFLKPKDREVECHASAWDVDMSGDLRIKMCIEVGYDDLVTIHHELGHNYYFHYYNHLPALLQQGANAGFHEGVGDTLSLAVTPSYLKQVGLLDKVEQSDEADINVLMRRALSGVAFLPFGYMIDRWRWGVFSGEVTPERYNASWWELRRELQGVAPPVDRSESHFDPGAKYHVAANVPYIRYFVAHILQYQFYRALCREAGHQGPLHRCTFYGNEAAGKKLIAMLKLGASKPWPEALEAVAGSREMDAGALLEYYAPLSAWLDKQNEGKQCGW